MKYKDLIEIYKRLDEVKYEDLTVYSKGLKDILNIILGLRIYKNF